MSAKLNLQKKNTLKNCQADERQMILTSLQGQ